MSRLEATQATASEYSGKNLCLSTLGVTTYEHLKHLKRCLTTYARHLRDFGRKCEFVVADDSSSSACRRANWEWLHSFARNFGATVYYAGHAERSRFIARLIAVGVPPTPMQFAFSNPLNIPFSPGANRNALLLHCVGKAFISCDDDSVCLVSDFRSGEQSVEFSRSDWQIDTHFYSSRRDAIHSVPLANCDFLAAHEALLGRTLKGTLPEDVQIFRGEPHRRDRVRDGFLTGSGRIGVTLTGVVGDSGIPDVSAFMLGHGDVRERFLHAWKLKGAPEISRNVVRGVSQPTITRTNAVWTTTATGFDHRVILPPFIPSGRGEDSLFGILLKKSSPSLFTANIPLGLLHLPQTEQFYAPPPISLRVTDLVIAMLEEFPGSPNSSAEERLRLIGRYLGDCARSSQNDFRECLIHYVQRWQTQWLIAGHLRLCLFDRRPLEWAQALESWLDRVRAAMLNSNVYYPYDLQDETKSVPEQLAKLRLFVKDFGDLLCVWPDIVEAASTLGSMDSSLGTLIH
jgi:hypothetical protein